MSNKTMDPQLGHLRKKTVPEEGRGCCNAATSYANPDEQDV